MSPVRERMDGTRWHGSSVHLLAAIAVFGLLVIPVAFAAGGDPLASKSAKLTKQIKSLTKQVKGLKQRVAALGAKPDQVGQAPASLPPSGPAGGGLTGNYPSPVIARGVVNGQNIADNSIATTDLGTFPAALVAGGSNTPVAVGTGTSLFIPFDDDQLAGFVDFDTGGIHSYTTDPDRFTAPVPGIYEISTSVSWSPAVNSDGIRDLGLLLTTPSLQVSGVLSRVPGTTDGITQQGSTLLALDTGDYVRTSVLQNSGSTIDARGDSMSIHWVGPSPP